MDTKLEASQTQPAFDLEFHQDVVLKRYKFKHVSQTNQS